MFSPTKISHLAAAPHLAAKKMCHNERVRAMATQTQILAPRYRSDPRRSSPDFASDPSHSGSDVRIAR